MELERGGGRVEERVSLAEGGRLLSWHCITLYPLITALGLRWLWIEVARAFNSKAKQSREVGAPSCPRLLSFANSPPRMPPSKPPYSTLPTASTSHLSPRPHRAQPPSDSEELETQERGRRAEEETEREDDDDEGDGNGREGLLSGVKREEEGKGVLLVGKDKEWLGKVKVRAAFDDLEGRRDGCGDF